MYGGQFATAAFRNGYRSLIPVLPGTKAPAISGWERTPISGWPLHRLKHFWNPNTRAVENGVGLVMTGELLAVDIDILDPEMAFDISMAVVSTIGDTPITRIGQAPKTLKLYRAGADLTTTTTRLNGLELFTRGGQIVVHGVHPVTKQPYYYPDQSPVTVPIDQLPEVSEAQLQSLIAAVRPMLPPVVLSNRQGTACSLFGTVDQIIDQICDESPDPTAAIINALQQAEPGTRHPFMMSAVIRFVAGGADIELLRDAYDQCCNHSPDRRKDFNRALNWAVANVGAL